LGGQHDSLQARAAYFIDRGCPNPFREVPKDGSLPGRVLAQACRNHVTHKNFINFREVFDPRSFYGGFHHQSA
jgi:hypothetical protein